MRPLDLFLIILFSLLAIIVLALMGAFLGFKAFGIVLAIILIILFVIFFWRKVKFSSEELVAEIVPTATSKKAVTFEKKDSDESGSVAPASARESTKERVKRATSVKAPGSMKSSVAPESATSSTKEKVRTRPPPAPAPESSSSDSEPEETTSSFPNKIQLRKGLIINPKENSDKGPMNFYAAVSEAIDKLDKEEDTLDSREIKEQIIEAVREGELDPVPDEVPGLFKTIVEDNEKLANYLSKDTTKGEEFLCQVIANASQEAEASGSDINLYSAVVVYHFDPLIGTKSLNPSKVIAWLANSYFNVYTSGNEMKSYRANKEKDLDEIFRILNEGRVVCLMKYKDLFHFFEYE